MKPTLHTVALIAALVAVGLLADAWRTARRDSNQLTATIVSQNTAIQQAADREKQRDAQLSTALASIATQKINVKTPQQAANAITSVLPALPLPISIHFPEVSPTAAPNEILPATVSVPQVDLKPIYDDLEDCRANSLDNVALKKDLADQKLQDAALTHERDAAVTAAHGGSFWVRLKRESKWFVIGIAVGAATTAIAHR